MRTKVDEGWGRLYRFTTKGLARVNLNCYESRMLQAIEYKTICFNKESDKIPMSQFEDLTEIDRRHHKRPLNGLIKKGVIWKNGNEYGLCKRYLEVEKVPNQVQNMKGVPIQGERVPNQVLKEYPTRYPHKNSHKNSHKKGLSASQREEKRKEYKTGLAMLKEAVKKSPSKKK